MKDFVGKVDPLPCAEEDEISSFCQRPKMRPFEPILIATQYHIQLTDIFRRSTRLFNMEDLLT